MGQLAATDGSGNHYAELSGSSEDSPIAANNACFARDSKPGHQRSDSDDYRNKKLCRDKERKITETTG